MAYQAPVEDILFALKSAADVPQLMASGVYDGLDEDTLRAIIEEAGKFGADVLDPLNRTGDTTGASLANGQVTTPAGWQDAYAKFCESGWNALTGPEAHGGQADHCKYCRVAEACRRDDSGFRIRLIEWMQSTETNPVPAARSARRLWWLGVEREDGDALVLLTDGLRTRQDFNQRVGMNVLFGDGSVRWNDDTIDLYESLPLTALATASDPVANIDYADLWSRIEHLATKR